LLWKYYSKFKIVETTYIELTQRREKGISSS